MLKECGEWVKTQIASGFKHVDYYEGQFDDLEEVVIHPPSVFIGYEQGEMGAAEDPLGVAELVLYVAATKLARTPGNMLDALETISAALHMKAARDDSNVYLGRCQVTGWKWRGAYPGIIVYEMRVRIRK